MAGRWLCGAYSSWQQPPGLALRFRCWKGAQKTHSCATVRGGRAAWVSPVFPVSADLRPQVVRLHTSL